MLVSMIAIHRCLEGNPTQSRKVQSEINASSNVYTLFRHLDDALAEEVVKEIAGASIKLDPA